MKTIVGSLVMLALVAPFAVAQETVDIQSAQNSLQYTLSNLRGSVDNMTKDNQELVAANERSRSQLVALQNTLSALKKEDDRVLMQFAALDEKHQKVLMEAEGLANQIAKLRDEEVRLDKRITELTHEIEVRERADAEMREQVDQKESDLRAQMATPPKSDTENLAHMTATRDRLEEQARTSEQALKRVKDEWMELQGLIQAGPGSVDNLKSRLNLLAQQIGEKEAECARLAEAIKAEQQAVQEAVSPEKTSPEALSTLEQEVRFLSDKYRALEKELKSGQKGYEEKIRKVSDADLAERRKLEDRLKETSKRNQGLKNERSQLRRQMVELDKKKSQLERAVYGNN